MYQRFGVHTEFHYISQESSGESDDESVSVQRTRNERKPAAPAPKPAVTTTRRPSATEVVTPHRPAARAPSTESSASTESSGSAVKHTGAILTIAELKAKYNPGLPPKPATRFLSTGNDRPAPVTTNGTAGGAQRVQSRFVGTQRPTPAPAPAEPAREDSDTSSEEETDSSEESEEEPVTQRKPESQAIARSDIGPLLARSSNARSDANDTKKESPSQTRYRTRQSSQTEEEEKPTSRYGSSGSSYSSNRYGSKPRDEETTSSLDDDSKYPTARSRYLALKERRNRLARSKSSHTGFGAGDDDDLDEPVSPTTASPSAYLAARYGSGTGGSELSRSRSSHALKSRESSPERVTASGEKDGAALSSWARYLKSKYGSRGKDRDTSSTSSSTSRRLSLGLPLRSANELASSDDDSKNAAGSPISPTAATAAVAG